MLLKLKDELAQDPRAFRVEIRRLVRSLAEHDRATALHSIRVGRYALWLAEAYRLDRDHRAALSVAARVHDVGKLCVPWSILNKPTRLSAAEFQQVQEHAAIGEIILFAYTSCPLLRGAVRSHHERYDGTGYPDGLTGERIPLLARVLAVADAFDAMTSYRPYSPVLSHPAALEVLRLEAGKQFDPDVVDRFTTICFRRHFNQLDHDEECHDDSISVAERIAQEPGHD